MNVPAGKQVDPETWVDASADAVQQGEVRVRLASATVDVVKFKKPTTDPNGKVKRLLLGLRITSLNYTQPFPYDTWSDPFQQFGRQEPRLTDNLNRIYHRVPFDLAAEPEG